MSNWQARGLFLGVYFAASCVFSQEVSRSVPSTRSEGTASSPKGTPSGPQGSPPGGPSGQPGRPGVNADASGTPGTAEKKGDKPADSQKVTTRPSKPTTPPNRDEFKIRPDKDGRIKFNFQGQPWPDMLVWLATISNFSLDYQEMPDGYLNLRTHRSYTVEEARDLVNRHLLDRGFTMLKHGEILSVVNVKKIDPSLVPRLAPGELDDHLNHEFAKVLFPLDSLMADVASEELKPMLSPNGRLSPLKKMNRIEVMDAVGNLREIRNVLEIEQSQKGRQRLVREFKLAYVRASDLKPQLQDLLGLEKTPDPANPAAGGMSPQQLQMMQQARMQQQGQPGQPGAQAAANKPPPVHFIVNSRENSLLANAPAEQMAVVAEAVRLLDIPSTRGKGQGLMQQVGRVRVHRLAALDPEPLIKMLEEVGDLDPSTRLQLDKKNRAIIVDAPLADHVTIATLVKKLDGTDRKFEVIKLRKLEADYVAGSIEFMMVGEKKKNKPNPFFWDYGYGGRNNEQEDESKKFRVDADVEHNRLLLWANAVELEEVHHLLVKLGEIPDPNGNQSRTRTLDTLSPEENRQLLERLRKIWPSVGNNPLEIDPRLAPDKDKESREQPDTVTPPATRRPRVPPALPPEKTTRNEERRSGTAVAPAWFELARADATDEAPPQREAPPTQRLEKDETPRETELPESIRKTVPAGTRSASLAPIRIGRGYDGQIVISSDDTEALDRLQDLLAEMAPARRDYKVFKMKHRTTYAVWVADNLRDFFEEKEKDKNSRWGGYWTSMANAMNGSNDERRLSKRKPLKFIADIDSNSILVRGADPNQLRIIEDLISTYDVAESSDSKTIRRTTVVRVQFSKARVIADAIKDVYRDLLSANDPALAGQNKDQKQKSPEAMYTYVYNSGGDDKKPEAPLKFKGMLSIGVDELSNMLVVSASESLMENVTATIKILDDAARPTVPRLQVVQVHRNVNAGELQKRLKNLLPRPQPQAKQQQQPQQPAQPQLPHPDSAIIIEN